MVDLSVLWKTFVNSFEVTKYALRGGAVDSVLGRIRNGRSAFCYWVSFLATFLHLYEHIERWSKCCEYDPVSFLSAYI